MLKRLKQITLQQTVLLKEMYKVHLLREKNIELLYQNRMNKYIEQINLNNNVNHDCKHLKSVILKQQQKHWRKEEKG
jgi:hypothetical protein